MTLRLSRAGSGVASAAVDPARAGFQMLMESGDLVKPALLPPNPGPFSFLPFYLRQDFHVLKNHIADMQKFKS